MENVIANVKGTIKGFGDKKRSRSHVIEQLVPSSGWTEDSNAHYLLVDLPGFKKEEVKLQVHEAGSITVSGERQINENKYVYFEKTIKVPDNTETDKITGKFDGEMLSVTVPKQRKLEEKKAPTKVETDSLNGKVEGNTHEKANENDGENSNGNCKREEKERRENGDVSEEKKEKWDDNLSILKSGIEILSKNKGIILTAALAFSLGVLVSHKFKST